MTNKASIIKYLKPIFQCMGKLFQLLYSKPHENYNNVARSDYLNFGKIPKKERDNYIKAAYKRAWSNRDFEINKFWTRAAYFWGFIALIFAAYFKFNEIDTPKRILLLSSGILFSIAWLYVIKGSKQWQENWEKHIDQIEDYITGPLYKTVWFNSKYYSVSKINEILAYYIIIVWLGLLYDEIVFPWEENALSTIDWTVVIILSITLLFCSSIIFGYARKDYKNEKGFIKREKEFF